MCVICAVPHPYSPFFLYVCYLCSTSPLLTLLSVCVLSMQYLTRTHPSFCTCVIYAVPHPYSPVCTCVICAVPHPHSPVCTCVICAVPHPNSPVCTCVICVVPHPLLTRLYMCYMCSTSPLTHPSVRVLSVQYLILTHTRLYVCYLCSTSILTHPSVRVLSVQYLIHDSPSFCKRVICAVPHP